MKVLKGIAELRETLAPHRGVSSIGLIPTMGYLHEGHLSLVDRSRKENDVSVTSIFVNPTQFGPGEDFAAYPRDLDRDVELAGNAGVDIVFAPGVEDMYPTGNAETLVDVGRIARICEGEYRPGHFVGVASVCSKLFNIVEPDRAYFGKKDAQQLAVIQKVVRELDFPIEIVGCDTVREPGGLAMSSRNEYLSQEERKVAGVIFRALSEAKARFDEGAPARSGPDLAAIVREGLGAQPEITVQYVQVVDSSTFEPVNELASAAIIAVAVFIGKTRLIDNLELSA